MTIKDNNRKYIFAVASILEQTYGCTIDDSNITNDCPQIYSNM